MKKIIVEDNIRNIFITEYLQKKLNISSALVYKTLRNKDIKVNSKRIKVNIRVNPNDIIEVYIPDEKLSIKTNIEVIYEDENIIIINKPKQIEVLGENSLTQIIQEKYSSNEILPCHRLDRNTDGIILYAKNIKIRDYLIEKFRTKEIKKFYLAKVYGIFNKKEDVLEDYLFKDSKKSQVIVSNTWKQGYKKIITKYKILKEDKQNNYSIVEIELKTGRTHQIRAHMAYINHPIIGDGKYGRNEINKQYGKKFQILTSYKLKFEFTDIGPLEYLNNKEFVIDTKKDYGI